MGLFRFIQSIFNAEIMGDDIINTNVKTYNQAKEMYPNLRTHDWLVATYLGRMQARGKQINPIEADTFCKQLINIPEPLNARALGLQMLYLERPDIINKYPKYENELNNILEKYDN